MEITSYRDLKIWQLGLDLAEHVYGLSSDFPKSELYGLTSQIRRAAVSVVSNIAEGHGRETTAAFMQYLRTAQGSLKEGETHLILAQRQGFAGAEDVERVLGRCGEPGRMTRSLIRSLQDRKLEGRS